MALALRCAGASLSIRIYSLLFTRRHVDLWGLVTSFACLLAAAHHMSVLSPARLTTLTSSSTSAIRSVRSAVRRSVSPKP